MINNKISLKRDKYLGCLIGGAAGDALGYPVEFMSEREIKNRFGDRGITEYVPLSGTARISDDTQMTLFTANGLLNSISEIGGNRDLGKLVFNVGSCYVDWLLTQALDYPVTAIKTNSWLMNVPELFSRRAPGHTCLSALKTRVGGVGASISHPVNDSKGCGGVMRVAPIGLFNTKHKLSIEETDLVAAEAAALTHGHALGYIPAAGLAHIVRRTAQDNMPLEKAVNDMIKTVGKLFAESSEINTFTSLMNSAVSLSKSDTSDIDAVNQLGEGWVAEEALAVAIFCALKYSDDFESALVASVNHNGDSDSTGAITGNILGAHLGLSAIPEKYLNGLELFDVTKTLAEDLLSPDVGSEEWESKYLSKTYKPC
jgi:ADP-ribosylglycohydrolase